MSNRDLERWMDDYFFEQDLEHAEETNPNIRHAFYEVDAEESIDAESDDRDTDTQSSEAQ